MTQLERDTLAFNRIESRDPGHEVIYGGVHWSKPGLEGVPIATDGASERNLESGGRLNS